MTENEKYEADLNAERAEARAEGRAGGTVHITEDDHSEACITYVRQLYFR